MGAPMTPRPKKKEKYSEFIGYGIEKSNGYNQACDDWEAFLPSEEEIEKILWGYKGYLNTVYTEIAKKWVKEISRAFHKRIRE
jgi:hypothetical protein